MTLATTNFSRINVLAVDEDHFSTDILGQMLRGFGVAQYSVLTTLEAARDFIQKFEIDLLICESTLPDGKGSELVQWLRRLPSAPIKSIPVVMLSSYTHASNVFKARDAGANTVIRKPISPKILMDHLIWAANRERAFIETDSYVGPDRRFKSMGPPDGIGRREGDVSLEIGDATEPNMSQEQLNSAFKPMRMSIE